MELSNYTQNVYLSVIGLLFKVINLQASSEPRRFVLNNGGLWRLAHDDQLLVRLHHNARELGEPHSYVDEALGKYR